MSDKIARAARFFMLSLKFIDCSFISQHSVMPSSARFDESVTPYCLNITRLRLERRSIAPRDLYEAG
ncbi:hypothetical protein [Paraburkholderia sp. J67]|uniref:hypothetical protein n=1 Tax=Paraburkholderia sp. J67 TaxID=2805435 RepID=UPI002ABE792A|nr:hypothetical protein [Paraburkholderia sp. J67]